MCTGLSNSPQEVKDTLRSSIQSKVLTAADGQTDRQTEESSSATEAPSSERQGNEGDFPRVAAHCVTKPLLSSQRATIDVYCQWLFPFFLVLFFFFNRNMYSVDNRVR